MPDVSGAQSAAPDAQPADPYLDVGPATVVPANPYLDVGPATVVPAPPDPWASTAPGATPQSAPGAAAPTPVQQQALTALQAVGAIPTQLPAQAAGLPQQDATAQGGPPGTVPAGNPTRLAGPPTQFAQPGAPVDPYAGTPAGEGAAPTTRQLAAAQAQWDAGYGVTPGQGGVTTAERAQGRAMDAATRSAAEAGAATAAAQQSHALAVAQANDNYVATLGKNDAAFQARRASNERQAVAENAAYAQNLENLAKQEPSPHRWFENQSSLGKVLWTMSLGFGAMAQSRWLGAKNIGLDMISSEIDADVARQKDRLTRQYEVAKLKGQQLDERHKLLLSDGKDDYAMAISRYGAARDAAVQRAQQVGTSADQRAAYLQAASAMDQKKADLLGQRTQDAIKARESQLSRDAESARQAAGFAHESTMKDLEFKQQEKMAGINAANERAKYDLEQQDKWSPIAPAAGIQLTDDKGQPIAGNYQVRKEDRGKAGDYLAAHDNMYSDLGVINDALKKGNITEEVISANPALNAAISRYTIESLKSEGVNRLTDEDIKQGKIMLTGNDQDKASQLKMWVMGNHDQAQKLVAGKMRDMINAVPAEFETKFGDTRSKPEGAQVRWSPPARRTAEPPVESPDEVSAQLGAPVAPTPPPKTADEYFRRKADTPDELGTLTGNTTRGDSIQSRVEDTLASFTGATPDRIAANTKATIAAVKANPQAAQRVQWEADAASKKAQSALDDTEEALRRSAVSGGWDEINAGDVKKEATRRGLDLSGAEVEKVLRALKDTDVSPHLYEGQPGSSPNTKDSFADYIK